MHNQLSVPHQRGDFGSRVIVTVLLMSCLTTLSSRRALAVSIIELDPKVSGGGMAVHPVTGDIYAAQNDRFSVYDSSGTFLRSFAETAPSAFPARIQVNSQGRALVQRPGLQLFSPAGDLEGTFSQFSDGEPIFGASARPALAPDGRVYISRAIDLGLEVEVFSPQGAFERSFTMPTAERRNPVLDFSSEGLLYIASDAGIGAGRTRQIEVLDSAGTLQRNVSLGTLSPTQQPLVSTLGFQVAPNGNLLVSRDALHIDVFSPQGQPLHTLYGGLQPTRSFDVTPASGVALREFANGSRIREFGVEEFSQLATDRPLLHFVDGPFGWARGGGTHPGGVIGEELDLVGIGSQNAASETAAGMFLVPGPQGVPRTIEVTWHPIIAAMDSFGVFDPTRITIDPAADPRGYAEQALRSGHVIFRNSDLQPFPNQSTPITKSLELEGGSTLAFFFTSVGSSTYEQYLANPTTARPPFFSLSGVNPGHYDQMVAFADEGHTLLGFEDLTATSPQSTADYNLSDEMFSFNVQLIPVPEPKTGLLMAIAWIAILAADAGRRLKTR